MLIYPKNFGPGGLFYPISDQEFLKNAKISQNHRERRSEVYCFKKKISHSARFTLSQTDHARLKAVLPYQAAEGSDRGPGEALQLALGYLDGTSGYLWLGGAAAIHPPERIDRGEIWRHVFFTTWTGRQSMDRMRTWLADGYQRQATDAMHDVFDYCNMRMPKRLSNEDCTRVRDQEWKLGGRMPSRRKKELEDFAFCSGWNELTIWL
ncbi:hypothetical protein C8R44DRAFT_957718 [Mycena epipterygia]|nr:hypothetical protein C8R44DRAFT_957718 [Mycena epipterygia]